MTPKDITTPQEVAAKPNLEEIRARLQRLKEYREKRRKAAESSDPGSKHACTQAIAALPLEADIEALIDMVEDAKERIEGALQWFSEDDLEAVRVNLGGDAARDFGYAVNRLRATIEFLSTSPTSGGTK